MYKIIQAKFSSKCAKSGKRIKKGDTILYDIYKKLAYIPGNEPRTILTKMMVKWYRHRRTRTLIIFAEKIIFKKSCKKLAR